MDPRNAGMPVGTGIGPSVVGQLVRDRSLRLSAGLAVAVAIPVAVLFYFQFRSIADLGRSSTVVLHQLRQETADGRTKSSEDSLNKRYGSNMLDVPQSRTEPFELEGSAEQIAGGPAARP